MIISNVMAVSIPSYPRSFSFFDRVNQWFHALIILRIRLHKINDIESVCLILFDVLQAEIVPLSETTSCIIVFKVQIILIVSPIINWKSLKYLHFNCSFQISTFKPTFENESTIYLSLGVVQLIVRLQFIIVSVNLLTVSFFIKFALNGTIIRAWDVKSRLINSYRFF